MPEGNKSRVSGDGLESKRPTTKLSLGSVESNQVYRMVKKSGLGVKNRGADLMGASGWSRPNRKIEVYPGLRILGNHYLPGAQSRMSITCPASSLRPSGSSGA